MRRPTKAQVEAMIEGSWTDLRAALFSASRHVTDPEAKARFDALLDATMFGPPELDDPPTADRSNDDG